MPRESKNVETRIINFIVSLSIIDSMINNFIGVSTFRRQIINEVVSLRDKI